MKNNIIVLFRKIAIPLVILGICSLVFNNELCGLKYIYSIRLILLILLIICFVVLIIDIINRLKRMK